MPQTQTSARHTHTPAHKNLAMAYKSLSFLTQYENVRASEALLTLKTCLDTNSFYFYIFGGQRRAAPAAQQRINRRKI